MAKTSANGPKIEFKPHTPEEVVLELKQLEEKWLECMKLSGSDPTMK